MATDVDTPARPSATIGHLLARRAQRAPDATALVAARGTFSYAQLDERADRVADGLERLGVGPGDRVALRLGAAATILEVLFACARVGAVVVPLPPGAAVIHAAAVLEDSDATVLVHDARSGGELDDVCADLGITSLATSSAATYTHAVATGTSRTGPRRAVDPDDPLLIAYAPDHPPAGAVHTHAAMLSGATICASELALGPADVVGISDPAASPIALAVTLAALSAGAQVTQLPTEPRALLRALARREVTVPLLPAALWARLTTGAHRWAAAAQSIRTALSTGRVADPIARRRLLEHLGERLWELTAVDGIFGSPTILPAALTHLGDAPLGQLVALHGLRVVDPQGVDVAGDETGELLVRGPAVCSGFWRRADLDERRLRDGGWLATGLRVTVGANGQIDTATGLL